MIQRSFVIPTFQASRFIGRSIGTLSAWAARRPDRSELVLVDDGSADGTGDLAEPLLDGFPGPARLLRLARNGGKGAALRAGLQAARGRNVIFTDHDLPYHLSFVDTAETLLHDHTDLVIGDRLLPGSRAHFRTPAREVVSRVLHAGVNAFVLPGSGDTQCGIKAFTRRAAQGLAYASWCRGFAIDVELLLLASHAGLRTARLPVQLVNDDTTTVRLLRDSLRVAAELLRMHVERRAPDRLLQPIEVPCPACGAAPEHVGLLAVDASGRHRRRCRRCHRHC